MNMIHRVHVVFGHQDAVNGATKSFFSKSGFYSTLTKWILKFNKRCSWFIWCQLAKVNTGWAMFKGCMPKWPLQNFFFFSFILLICEPVITRWAAAAVYTLYGLMPMYSPALSLLILISDKSHGITWARAVIWFYYKRIGLSHSKCFIGQVEFVSIVHCESRMD